MKDREAPSLASAGEDSFDISPLLRGEKPAQPIRKGMVHVNYGSYTLAIRDGDWKLILPAGVYAVQDGTVTPDHIIETQGKGPNEKFQLYNLHTAPSSYPPPSNGSGRAIRRAEASE